MGCHIASIAPQGPVRSREAIERLVNDELDLSRHVELLRRRENVSEHDASRAAILLRKGLILMACHPDTYIWIHEEADSLLHIIVLDTRRYPEFCQQVFGGMLEHTLMLPGDPLPEPVETTIERTTDLWRAFFNEDFASLGTIWH